MCAVLMPPSYVSLGSKEIDPCGHVAHGLGITFTILYSVDQLLISEPKIGKFGGTNLLIEKYYK